jgi:hypothetical protein
MKEGGCYSYHGQSCYSLPCNWNMWISLGRVARRAENNLWVHYPKWRLGAPMAMVPSWAILHSRRRESVTAKVVETADLLQATQKMTDKKVKTAGQIQRRMGSSPINVVGKWSDDDCVW